MGTDSTDDTKKRTKAKLGHSQGTGDEADARDSVGAAGAVAAGDTGGEKPLKLPKGVAALAARSGLKGKRLELLAQAFEGIAREPKVRPEPEDAYVDWIKEFTKEARDKTGLSFDKVAEILCTEYGQSISGQSLRSKLNQGTTSMYFCLMLLDALGVRNIPVPTIKQAKEAQARYLASGDRRFKGR